MNINRNNAHYSKWEHNSEHRRGVAYNNAEVKNKFAKANINGGDRNLDFRGRSGDQVLKPGSGDHPNIGGGDRPGGKPGNADRPNVGGGDRPGGKPDAGQIQQGLKDRSDKQAALPNQKSDVGKAKAKAKAKGGRAEMPSIRAMAERPKTSPSAGRQVSAIAAPRISPGLLAAAGRRSARAAVAAGLRISVAAAVAAAAEAGVAAAAGVPISGSSQTSFR